MQLSCCAIHTILIAAANCVCMCTYVLLASAMKLGWVNRVTFSLGHLGPTRFTNYLARLDHVRNKIVRLTTWKLINANRVVLL